MNKTKDQIKAEMKMQNTEKFLKAYHEAYEEHVTPINKKFGLRLIPVILANKVGGLNPGYGLEEYKEVTPPSVDEDTLATETKQ